MRKRSRYNHGGVTGYSTDQLLLFKKAYEQSPMLAAKQSWEFGRYQAICAELERRIK